MPIKIPNNLPAAEILNRENIFFMTETRAMTQDIRALRVLIMNLMPTKLAKAWEHQDIDTLREYDVTTCMECGCCSYSCPARKQLSFEIKLAKTWVMTEDRKAAEKAKAEAEATKAKEEEKKEGGDK